MILLSWSMGSGRVGPRRWCRWGVEGGPVQREAPGGQEGQSAGRGQTDRPGAECGFTICILATLVLRGGPSLRP